MSVAYSNSPADHLQIAESRIRRALWYALALAQAAALMQLALAGYFALVWVFAVPVVLVTLRLYRQEAAGGELRWRAGRWTLLRADGQVSHFTLQRCQVALPWVVYLQLRRVPDGAVQALWIFSDSAGFRHYRRLRVALVVARDSRA
ncbi:MAG: protein YgfX [Halioglobus sp.]|nr:protein YgfX [Halioglobus sp.]